MMKEAKKIYNPSVERYRVVRPTTETLMLNILFPCWLQRKERYDAFTKSRRKRNSGRYYYQLALDSQRDAWFRNCLRGIMKKGVLYGFHFMTLLL
jgi:hypothetical protein